jgi:tRNA modification GTPase
MVYGNIISDGKVIDDGLCVKFCAPRSFTGEDTVEINCHGGIYITQKVLAAVFSAGARPAEAGEFTRRAFVNGKMALSQAEALGTLLEAKNDGQIELARNVMGGKIKAACDELYSKMVALVASVYANVDYPEEDLADMSNDEMTASTGEILESVRKLRATYKAGHAVMEGVKTVICGKPNVGKSSLYNVLVGREAAIVTEIEGTTRDLLTETVSLGRVVLRLVDTAGIRDTEDKVERIGVERARASLDEAELVLAVFDNSRPLDDEDFEIMDKLKMITATKVAIINKNDENPMISEDEISKHFDKLVKISAKSENNVDELKQLIEKMYINEELDISNDAVLINARQDAALCVAEKHLLLALEALKNGLSPDIAGVDIELAMSHLSEIDGREVDEDIVANIFSHFCVGK